MEERASRGIFLVANRFSSDHCHNLIYSIRETGCRLPIRIIPWGGEPMRLKQRFDDVELVSVRDFSPEAQSFVADVKRRMPKCVRPGNLNRYLAWFGEDVPVSYGTRVGKRRLRVHHQRPVQYDSTRALRTGIWAGSFGACGYRRALSVPPISSASYRYRVGIELDGTKFGSGEVA